MTKMRLLILTFLITTSLPVYAAAPYAEQEKPETAIPSEEAITPTPEEDLEAAGVVSPMSEDGLETVEEERVNVSDVDFDTVESFGLLEQARGEGLGKQFYAHSRRSAITALVNAMPKSDWSLMQNLGNQVLLTSANTAALDNDVPADYATAKDLLTLRVEKLLERGLNREAYTFYTRLKVEPYNEKLARLGIISMLLNAQKPLACVEMKTSTAPGKTDIFWKEMDAYCVLSLSDQKFPDKEAIIKASRHKMLQRIVEDKSFRFSYTAASFGGLSLFEKALLIGENRLDVSDLTEASYDKIPAEHLQALLTIPTLDDKTRILLSAKALEKGVLTPYDFGKVYIKIGRKAEKEKRNLAGFGHIASVYWKRLDTFEPQFRAASIAEVLGHMRQYGYALLVPFLDDFSNLTPTDSFTIDDLHAIVRAYFISGKEIPAQWLDVIQKAYTPQVEQQKLKEILLISAALLSGDQGNSPDKLKGIYGFLKKPLNPPLQNLKNIIENIDNRTGDYAKVRIAYENGFDIGTNKSYTMPPTSLMEQLEMSSKGHATGETVLLCNLILQGIGQQSIYPGVLADVAKALSEVGLSKQAQRLLAEVVLSHAK